MSTVVDRIMAGGGQILINSTGTYATRAPGNVPESPSPGNWHPVVLVVVRTTGTDRTRPWSEQQPCNINLCQNEY